MNETSVGGVKRPTSYDLGLGLSTSLQQNVWGEAAPHPNIWSVTLLLILALLLLLIGTVLLRVALRAGRRYGLTSRSFWLTFRGYTRYRIRRTWPAALGLLGAMVVLAGAGLAFMWLLSYYAARLGHPVNPGGS